VTANAAQIGLLSTEDFRQYKALVFGDSFYCDPGFQSSITASRAAWSQATVGNAVVIGGPELDSPGLISNALDFVAAEQNKTGLYFSFGCLYYLIYNETQVSALAGIGTFKVVGVDSYIQFSDFTDFNSHILAAHPVTVGLTDAILSADDIATQVFTSYPSSFKPLTIARNRGEEWRYAGFSIPISNYSDGTRGIPTILARGGFGAVCGNGVIEAGEECDDTNVLNGDGCSLYCRIELCGDGLVGQGEECDAGNYFGGYNCSSRCTVVRCGDGFVDWPEQCDDNNTVDFDGCNSECNLEYCGDGIVQPGEECDDIYDDDFLFDDVYDPDRCVNCKVVEPCGNGVVQPLRGEQCDDGNRVDGDGCSSDCKIECKATSRPCDVVSQCCSPADKVCEGPTPRSQTCQVCKAVGKPCARYKQCCGSANKVCEGPAGKPKSCQVCKAVGKPCARYTQCCGSANKVCEGPAGKPKSCQVCKKRNAACARSTQCCAGLKCKNRKCLP
jgi:cysteine-rich repeat protein